MTDRHNAGDYSAFLRGFAAALDQQPVDFASESSAYLEGVTAAAQPMIDTRRYRELSTTHDPVSLDSTVGSFTGTLADVFRTAWP